MVHQPDPEASRLIINLVHGWKPKQHSYSLNSNHMACVKKHRRTFPSGDYSFISFCSLSVIIFMLVGAAFVSGKLAYLSYKTMWETLCRLITQFAQLYIDTAGNKKVCFYVFWWFFYMVSSLNNIGHQVGQLKVIKLSKLQYGQVYPSCRRCSLFCLS